MYLNSQIFSCRLIILFVIGLYTTKSSAQVYLYLEDMTQVKAIKIPERKKISIRTKENKTWTTYFIERLDPESKILIFKNGYLHLEEITHIRIQRRWVNAIGTALQRFGIGWGLYGAIALAAGLSNVETSVVITGTLVPIAVGWLMKKIWLWKRYSIGAKNRLKILDLSFPDDPYGVKQQKTYRP